MVDLFLECIDRDAEPSRQSKLETIRNSLQEKQLGTSGKRQFFGQVAWAEIEVWIMAAMDYSQEFPDWNWAKIRADRDVKDNYYEPYAKWRNLFNDVGSGRDILGREVAKRYRTILQKCPGDLGHLQNRVGAWLATR